MGAPLNWKNAAQGDVVALKQLAYWNGPGQGLELIDTPDGVVLVSQTCDLVQTSTKHRVLVAPAVRSSGDELGQVKKGRKPLLVLVGSGRDLVADLERVTSIPRAVLSQVTVVDQTCGQQSGNEAAELAARIGRVFSRFAFPDEVHTALKRLIRKVADGYTKDTSFAAVLSRLNEFRVGCDDWSQPHRHLTIYAIVDSDFLPPVDARSDDWVWSADSVTGITRGARPEELSIETLSSLILANGVAENDSALVELWEWWGVALHSGWLDTCDEQVSSIRLEVISASELTYETYMSSEAIDFSTLSFASEGD